MPVNKNNDIVWYLRMTVDQNDAVVWYLKMILNKHDDVVWYLKMTTYVELSKIILVGNKTKILCPATTQVPAMLHALYILWPQLNINCLCTSKCFWCKNGWGWWMYGLLILLILCSPYDHHPHTLEKNFTSVILSIIDLI